MMKPQPVGRTAHGVLQTVGCPATAIAVRLCGREPDGADGRAAGAALVDMLARLSIDTCRISLRVASPAGSRQLDVGFVIEGLTRDDAYNVANAVGDITAAISPGLSPTLWELSRTAFAIDPRSSHVSRIGPGQRVNTQLAGGRFSPLCAYLSRLDVEGVISVAYLPSMGRPMCDLICTSTRNPTEVLAALTTLEISTATQPVAGLGVHTADGLAAIRLLETTTTEAINHQRLLAASALADIYSTFRRAATAPLVYGRRRTPNPFPMTYSDDNDFSPQPIEWTFP